MAIDRNIWPELVYRFVEHYRWEPHHLGPDTSAFYRKIRSQEVPLNFLFNLLLHALPATTRRSTLSITSGISAKGSPLQIVNPLHSRFTQPDVQLESDDERVFVELKIRARTNLEQAQKYGLLHSKLAVDDTAPKSPSLIYITREKFRQHWMPARESPSGGDDLARRLSEAALSEKLKRNREVRSLEARFRSLSKNLSIGFTTWQEIGDHLSAEAGRAPELAKGFIDGFLADLVRRKLWESRRA